MSETVIVEADEAGLCRFRLVTEQNKSLEIAPTKYEDILHVIHSIVNGRRVAIDVKGIRINIGELLMLCRNVSNIWNEYIVFADLLRRGKKPRIDAEQGILLIEDQRVQVIVLKEDEPVSIRALLDAIEKAQRRGYASIIAVVDIHGDVTYYEASKIVMPKIERKVGDR